MYVWTMRKRATPGSLENNGLTLSVSVYEEDNFSMLSAAIALCTFSDVSISYVDDCGVICMASKYNINKLALTCSSFMYTHM